MCIIAKQKGAYTMEEIKITMFGSFSITVGDKKIDETCRRSKNMWTLLEYIITFRGKEIQQNELIDLLYDDSSNPASALKTQLCRLREVLDELSLSCGKEMIVNCPGGYTWNTKLDCYIDADEFEKLCNEAFHSNSDYRSRVDLILRATKLYKGDFLPSQSSESWAVPVVSYYHSMYIKAIYLALDLLFEHGEYAEVISLCRSALIIDQYDEYIYTMKIKALSEQGDKKSARELYHRAVDIFYNKLGVNPSEEFLQLYKETVYDCHDMALDFDRITTLLNEDSDVVGAFYCEYEFFKYIYKLEKKASSRDGRTVHLCVLSVTDENGGELGSKKLSTVMDKLIDCITFSLRSSDVFTRVSLSQYAVLIASATEENINMIMKRITKRFKRDNPRITAKITYNLKNISS